VTEEQAILALSDLREIAARHERGEPFRVRLGVPTSDAAQAFVRFRVNPPRFTRKIFDGDWAHADKHAKDDQEGRVLRVVTGFDGVSRVIFRQHFLYACPWISWEEILDSPAE
jgi:hypothetical protein